VVRPDPRHRDYDGRARLERVHAGPQRPDERAREGPWAMEIDQVSLNPRLM